MANTKNCWGCGDNLARVCDPGEEFVKDGHTYCREFCYYAAQSGEPSPDFPVDFDEQDRNAAASERIARHRAER